MRYGINTYTAKAAVRAGVVATAVYGFASAIVAHAGLWEAANTWEGLGIAAVATGATVLNKYAGWLERR